MLPGLGSFIGYAVTVEVTTNDEDSVAASFEGHYRNLMAAGGPSVAVFKDVDTRPGRGASFGEGMSILHRRFGAVGLLVDGTIRDLDGMRARQFPALAWGVVPGHGRFKAIRLNVPVTVGGLRIHPGDLLAADPNGCVKIPVDKAAEILRLGRAEVAREKKLFVNFQRGSLPLLKKLMKW
jgi:regulator of RNase E activity RraA